MKITRQLILLTLFSLIAGAAAANCCRSMGGIRYCDSSAGRFVCNNGSYSSCYCTNHAVMDLQKLEGCCLWHGGVMKVDLNNNGIVICNDGSVSASCTYQNCIQTNSVSSW